MCTVTVTAQLVGQAARSSQDVRDMAVPVCTHLASEAEEAILSGLELGENWNAMPYIYCHWMAWVPL